MGDIVNHGRDNPPPQPRCLRDYTTPVEYNASSCIILDLITQWFEILSSIIQRLPIYHGKNKETPSYHLKTLFTICSTFSFDGVSEKQISLKLFPFSLMDKATNWLDSLSEASINSWTVLSTKFPSKNFTTHRTNALIPYIMSFCQQEGETISQKLGAI